MGVSGCGKTYFGKKAAQILKCEFIDADNFHTQENIEKMREGIALTDLDRKPWLEKIHGVLLKKYTEGSSAILACSMLKNSHQKFLLSNLEAKIIYLEGSYAFIIKQLQQRQGHFFPPSLLKSQFDILQVPKSAITISIEQSEEKTLTDMVKNLKNSRFGC
ncbi:gluconate kinase [Candidatus Aerophobetes bacterium]|uniref:Gluconokinase n=1 Tax=Aerophobetes bacterium TaxID=2030807 RepID=A0A2A4X3D2_UNCAE|nr:MAG: gluconate kinase [Candidatus Aerophobetes bacterium]